MLAARILCSLLPSLYRHGALATTDILVRTLKIGQALRRHHALCDKAGSMRLVTVLRAWAAIAMVFAVANATVPNKLDLPLLREVTPDRGTNQAVSPFLVTNVLSQLWFGAKKNTRKEIGTTLGITSLPQLITGYIDARRALSKQSSVTTNLFNRVYIREGFNVKGRFLAIIRRIYGVSVQRFSSVPAAVQAINSDVARETNDRITNLVDEGALKGSRMVLVGALYFKGKWKKEFETAQQQNFLTSSGDKLVPMMKLETQLAYRKFQDYDVVSLPYNDENYQLLIFRPLQRSQVAVNKLYLSLRSLDIEQICSQLQFSSEEVIVTMPKFKIESEYKLKSQLSALGIRKMFTTSAEFRGITDTRVLVSEVIHKVFMEVNEEGTEAAAAVGVVVGVTSIRIPKDFTVDRPFLAVLYHKKQKLNLFSAWVANPTT